MHIGVSFPTLEIGADSTAIRDFVQTAEGAGYTHLRILDHVLNILLRKPMLQNMFGVTAFLVIPEDVQVSHLLIIASERMLIKA